MAGKKRPPTTAFLGYKTTAKHYIVSPPFAHIWFAAGARSYPRLHPLTGSTYTHTFAQLGSTGASKTAKRNMRIARWLPFRLPFRPVLLVGSARVSPVPCAVDACLRFVPGIKHAHKTTTAHVRTNARFYKRQDRLRTTSSGAQASWAAHNGNRRRHAARHW